MPETYQHWHVTLASFVDNMVLTEEDILHKRSITEQHTVLSNLSTTMISDFNYMYNVFQ